MNTEQKIIEAIGGVVDIQKYLTGLRVKNESIAERLLKQLPDFMNGKQERVRLDLTPMEVKTAITSTGAQNDPLVQPYHPVTDAGQRLALRVRDLLPVFATTNGAIEYPVKTATNNAASQNRENTALAESAYSFTMSFQPCETIGHFVPVSTQLMEDSGTFDAFISQELLYGLQEETEDQLLNGTNSNSQLYGMLTGATAYTVQSPQLTNEIDLVRDAMKQVEIAGFNVSGIVLNPSDWYDIDTRKASTTDNTYASGSPRMMGSPSLWGVPVATSTKIASGSFLVGDFNRAAILFDRQQPTVELARHDGTNFQKGMITARATERLSLVIANPTAIVTGSL